MPVNNEELLKAAVIVADTTGMKVALSCSLKAATATGMTTFVGGILGGPVGLLIGGTVGGLGSMLATKGKFKPVSQIIKEELTADQKAKLLGHLRAAVTNVDAVDLITLIAIQNNREIIWVVAEAIKTFLSNDMYLKALTD